MIAGTKFDFDLDERVFYIRDSEVYVNDTSILITVPSGVEGGEDLPVTVYVEDLYSKGRVQLWMDGTLIDTKYTTGEVTFTIKSVACGVHTLKAVFTGNNYCLGSEGSVIVDIPGIETNLSLTSNKDTVSFDDSFILSISMSPVLDDVIVKLYKDNVFVEELELVDGEYDYPITADGAMGYSTYKVVFEGTVIYESAEATVTVLTAYILSLSTNDDGDWIYTTNYDDLVLELDDESDLNMTYDDEKLDISIDDDGDINLEEYYGDS